MNTFYCRIYQIAFFCLALFAGLRAEGANHSFIGWWNPAYRYRQVIEIEAPDGIESDVAWVKIATGGMAREDGGDIRVTNARGIVVPSRVLHHELFYETLVVFEAKDPSLLYCVYYGNLAAGAPAAVWQPKKGCCWRPEGQLGRSRRSNSGR